MEDARIEVREGGQRGMTVSVRLQHPDDATLAQVRQTLGAFLFASDISAVER